MIAAPPAVGLRAPLVHEDGSGRAIRKSTRRKVLEGHLNLVCEVNRDGHCYISRQSFCAPFHISKPYWNEQALVVQIVNPTAGLFAGDTLRCEVRVGSGARLHLTTPSASRIHAMRSGRAELRQHISVARGGWLEFQPSLLIPQNGSRYRQKTCIEVESGGEIFFVETFAPGRVAHGEAFGFSVVDWEFDLYYQQRLIARERFVLRPTDSSLAPLKAPFPHAYFASGYLVSEQMDDRSGPSKEIRELNSTSALVGMSRLTTGAWSIKIIAQDSMALSQTIQSIRHVLAAACGNLRSTVRKL